MFKKKGNYISMRFYIIVTLLIFILNIGCNSTQKKPSSELEKRPTKECNKKASIHKYLLNGNMLKFPIKLDVMNPANAKLDTSISFNPIIGYLPDTSDFYGFLTLTIGDLLYPTIETYNKKGELIQEEIIVTGNCIHPIADIESCFDSVTINENLYFEGFSKLVGELVDLYDSPSNSPSIDICKTKTLSGKILPSGVIEIKVSERTECEK
jgi:hypothetical protein